MSLARFFIGLGMFFCAIVVFPRSADAGFLYGQVEVNTKDHRPLGDLSGVVVYLKEVNGNKGFSPAKGRLSMASENMRFNPEILPVLEGSSVVFPNNEDMIHNAFSVSDAKKFDFGRYGFGEENSALFDKPGPVTVYCKIHPRMTGYILVLENPFFTMTDEKGNYTLKGVPIGNYKAVAWFPFGESQEKKADLTQGEKAEVDFSLVKMRNSNPRKNPAEKKR